MIMYLAPGSGRVQYKQEDCPEIVVNVFKHVSSHLVLRCQRAVTAKVSMTIRKFRIQNSSAGH